MNIGVDVRCLMDQRYSGVQQYALRIIQEMLRLEGKHTFHLFYNSAKKATLPDFQGRVVWHRFAYPNRFLNAAQWLLRYPRWSSLLPPLDVVFMPTLRLMPFDSAVPVVVTVHDLSYERFPELFDWKRRVWHGMMRPRQLMRQADKVIAVSGHTARDLESLYGLASDQIEVIHSGVPLDQARVTQDDITAVCRTHQLPKEFVLYFGTLEPRKNVVSIIQAFDAIAERVPHDLVIAGQRGWLTQNIDEALEQAVHRNRIHVLGFVAESEKAALYAGASMFVYPSLYEGFGFPPLEALLAGTPVITSFNSALPEIVGKWATLVDPYNVGELALVLEETLIRTPSVSESMKHEIRQAYSWEEAARRTLHVLETV